METGIIQVLCYIIGLEVLFGDTMVPSIEQDYILHLGYSILYKEYNLTRFNHQKNTTHQVYEDSCGLVRVSLGVV